MIKKLHEFTLYKPSEVEIEKEIELDGKLVTVKEKVNTELPVKFFIKKPSRSQIETIEFEYDKEFHRLTSAGILPKALMIKQYLQVGGMFTEDETEARRKIAKDLADKIDQFERASTDEVKDEDKIKTLGQEILEGQAALQTFSSLEETLLSNCAETKARNKTINYILVNFCYVDPATPEKPNEKPYLFFKGDSTDEKLDDYSEKTEEGDAFTLNAVEFFTFFVGLWYFNRANKPEEFKKFEEEFRRNRNVVDKGTEPGKEE